MLHFVQGICGICLDLLKNIKRKVRLTVNEMPPECLILESLSREFLNQVRSEIGNLQFKCCSRSSGVSHKQRFEFTLQFNVRSTSKIDHEFRYRMKILTAQPVEVLAALALELRDHSPRQDEYHQRESKQQCKLRTQELSVQKNRQSCHHEIFILKL